MRISFRHAAAYSTPEVLGYDFLPNGVLIRREEQYLGLLTSWEDGQVFSGKLVPRHIAVQGAGLPGPMVTADVSLVAAGPADSAIAQLPGAAADPGMTLSPIENVETDVSGSKSIHFEMPKAFQGGRYPAGVKTVVIAVIDRQGMPRDIEVSAMEAYGQPPSRQDLGVVTETAREMVLSMIKDRWHPALIDGKPCEVYWSL
ncbi:MAG: hypothetical protein WA414_20215, partial [Acidobacteriaceae bacterium]